MLIHSTLNRMHTQLYFDVIMHERNTCLYSSCIFCINVQFTFESYCLHWYWSHVFALFLDMLLIITMFAVICVFVIIHVAWINGHGFCTPTLIETAYKFSQIWLRFATANCRLAGVTIPHHRLIPDNGRCRPQQWPDLNHQVGHCCLSKCCAECSNWQPPLELGQHDSCPSIFRRLKRPFSRAKARSITQRDVDRVVLNFRCFDVRRPVSLYGTISCFMSGYAASPTMWPSFGNMLGSVLIRSKKSDLFKTVASCTDPTSPAWQSVNFRSALHTACRMMEWWPFLLT